MEWKNLGPLSQIFRRVVSCILRAHRNNLKKNSFSEKIEVSKHFRTLSEKFWPFFEKFLTRLSKLQPICLYELLRIFFSEKLKSFSYFLDIESKNFELFSEKFWRGCQNCIQRVSRNILIRNIFFGRKIGFFGFFDIERKIVGLLSNIFGWALEIAIYMSMGKFWRWKTFWKYFPLLIIFGHWAKFFLLFVQYFSARLWKLLSTCSEKHFREKYFVWKKLKNFFHRFRTMSEKNSASCQQLWSGSWNLHSAFLWERFNGKIFFLKKFRFFIIFEYWPKNSGRLSKNFWRDCHHSNLLFHGNIFSKFI